jgi:hypothetical protein
MPRRSSLWTSLLTTRARRREAAGKDLFQVLRSAFIVAVSTTAKPHTLLSFQALSRAPSLEHEPHQQLCDKRGLDVPTADRPDQAQSRHSFHVTCKSLCGSATGRKNRKTSFPISGRPWGKIRRLAVSMIESWPPACSALRLILKPRSTTALVENSTFVSYATNFIANWMGSWSGPVVQTYTDMRSFPDCGSHAGPTLRGGSRLSVFDLASSTLNVTVLL